MFGVGDTALVFWPQVGLSVDVSISGEGAVGAVSCVFTGASQCVKAVNDLGAAKPQITQTHTRQEGSKNHEAEKEFQQQKRNFDQRSEGRGCRLAEPGFMRFVAIPEEL